MTATVQRWESSVKLPVVDALTQEQPSVFVIINGEKQEVLLDREVWNAPLAWMLPDNVKDVIIIDWRPLVDHLKFKLEKKFAEAKASGTRLGSFKALLDAQIRERLLKPIVFHEREYFVYGWGSGAKEFQTLGFTEDFMRQLGLVRCIEDYARVSRCLVPNGWYGGGVVKARILLVKNRTSVGPHYLVDGAGFAADDIIKPLLSEREPIWLSNGAQNFQIWQHFAFTEEFEREWEAAQNEMIDKIKNVPATFVARYADIGEYKRTLLLADEYMIHHPLFGAPVIRKGAEILFNCGTTFALDGYIKCVLPTHLDRFVADVPGEHQLFLRWPIDAKSNIQATEAIRDEEYQKEIERLNGLGGAIQHSLSNKAMHAKGMLAYGKRISDSWDIAMTVEDFKMVVGQDIKDWRKNMAGRIIEAEFFLSITQHYTSQSLCFAPADIWVKMGGDYDGDLAFIMPCDKYPEVFRQAWEWRNKTNSAKIKKSKTPINDDDRVKFLMMAWSTGVGFAVNLYAATFLEQPDRRIELVHRILTKLPSLFSFLKGKEPSVDDLEYVMNRAVKIGTDVFKTMDIDLAVEDKLLRQIQGVLTAAYDGTPSWVLWRRSSIAFRTTLPVWRSELPQWRQEEAEKNPEFRRSEEWRIHLSDKMSRATIARIYDKALPWIREQWMKLKQFGTLDIVEALQTAPLSDFVNWAPSVSEVDLLLGRSLCELYNVLATATNFEDPIAVKALEDSFRSKCDEAVRELFGGSRKLASYATWRASHHSRSKITAAAAVFTGFPDEALEIVRMKPGLINPGMVKVLDHTVADIAARYGCTAEEIQAANPGRTEFAIDDYIKLPERTVKTVVIGIQHNFTAITATIGPFVGRVERVGFGDKTRLAVMTDDKLPNHVGSDLGKDVVGLIPRIDFKDEREGISAPNPGRYLITLNQVKDRSGKGTLMYRGHLSPL